MLLLANCFALGSMAGGIVVALLSCFLIRDATAWFPFVWAGYSAAFVALACFALAGLLVLAFLMPKTNPNAGRSHSFDGTALPQPVSL